MKSRYFLTIFFILVLSFSCLSTINSVAASDSNSTQEFPSKETIAGLIDLGVSDKTLALHCYGNSSNSAISKLYTDLRQIGFKENQISKLSQNSDNGLSLKKGAIYEKNKAIGIWNGKDAYTLNSAGKLVISKSYTSKVKKSIAIGQTLSTKVSTSTTTKTVKFVNNVASNKVTNSAVYSLSRVYTQTNRGSLALKLLAADIATGNLGAKKFSGSNVYISTNAIVTVLNGEVSKKYIANKEVKQNTLKSALEKGKAILRIKGADNKFHFIAISKVSNQKVTVYDNKNKQSIAINSLSSYLTKKKFKFSGVAITFNEKIGNTPSTDYLKATIGV